MRSGAPQISFVEAKPNHHNAAQDVRRRKVEWQHPSHHKRYGCRVVLELELRVVPLTPAAEKPCGKKSH